jgi:pimeloyl-ACP methyl ester carboxylesterase
LCLAKFYRPVAHALSLLALVLSAGVLSADRAYAQNYPCGVAPYTTLTLTPNSPPVQATVGLGTYGGAQNGNYCGGTCSENWFTSINFSISAPWVTLSGVQVLPPPNPVPQGYATLTFDTRGLAPGLYCVPWQQNETTAGTHYLNGPVYYGGSFSISFMFQVTVAATNTTVELIDPVPDLVSGNAVKSSTQLQNQLTSGRIVKGVASDGVTEVLIRIDTTGPGHQFTVTLVDDQGLSGPNIIPSEDGALDVPGGTSFSSGQLTVAAGGADSFGMGHAFAVYRAPVDFARPTSSGFKTGTCQGSSKFDDQLSCRAVSLQVQDITANTPPTTISITVVRPPVFLIHGLWADWKDWTNFFPLVISKRNVDRRFHVERLSYDWLVGPSLMSSSPTYTLVDISTAKANSLGPQYLAPFVLAQMKTKIGVFENGDNPSGMSVAAIQGDVIAHSLGGIVTRTLPLTTGFFSNTFNQGLIHKVISLDVPHLGSPLAPLLLGSSSDCVREVFAQVEYFSFTSATFKQAPNTPADGAVGDLVNSPLSTTLKAIAQQGPHPLPTALIAANYTNFASLDCTPSNPPPGGHGCAAYLIRTECGAVGDPLGAKFTSTAWPLIFGPTGSNSNDALVDQNSQLNGLAVTNGTNGFIYPGLVHSPGTESLSFTGPSVLDSSSAPNPIANQVITLLNTPYTQVAFLSLNP